LLTEIMILRLGGQGGVTAARILALTAVYEGMYAQAIPHFGAERRGALVRSYLRISDEPIRRHSSIKIADTVAIFSRKILDMVDVNPLVKSGAIVNSPEPVKITDETYYVDAANIALKLNLVSAGWPIVNTAMAGAMAKMLGLPLDSLLKALSETFSGKLLEVNSEAAKLAYEEVAKC